MGHNASSTFSLVLVSEVNLPSKVLDDISATEAGCWAVLTSLLILQAAVEESPFLGALNWGALMAR